VIVRTEPEPFATVEDLRAPVRFHFDERISEQVQGGALDDAVTVSPRGGAVDVGHGSRSISIEIEGGLRPGVVYRVTLLPVISDLFGNQMRDPFELVFSTGGEAAPTTVAGEIWDRVSGQGVRGASVQAVGPDSLVHLAQSDEEGVFAFRYLPAGSFVVTGFQDQDRDGEVDERELKGSVPVSVATGDTLIIDVPLLAPDTTAAVLARATPLDSVTVALEFDDYLDPSADVTGIDIAITRDAGGVPGISRLFHEADYTAYVARVNDSIGAAAPPPSGGPAGPPPTAPDSAVAQVDTTAAQVDGAAAPPTPGPVPGAAPRPERPAGPPALPGARRAAGPQSGGVPGRVLPGRRLAAVLDAPLEPGAEYRVRAAGVVNLNGLGGGGGEVDLVLAAATPDSAAAPAPPPGGNR